MPSALLRIVLASADRGFDVFFWLGNGRESLLLNAELENTAAWQE